MSKNFRKSKFSKSKFLKRGSYEKYLPTVVFDVDSESAIRFDPEFFEIFETRSFSYQMIAKIKSLLPATFKSAQNCLKKFFSCINSFKI